MGSLRNWGGGRSNLEYFLRNVFLMNDFGRKTDLFECLQKYFIMTLIFYRGDDVTFQVFTGTFCLEHFLRTVISNERFWM